MKIMQLSREDIPIVCEGGGLELIEEINKELDEAELCGYMIYVRYGPMFLQWLRVDNELLNDPHVKEIVLDENMWEQQRVPNINKGENND